MIDPRRQPAVASAAEAQIRPSPVLDQPLPALNLAGGKGQTGLHTYIDFTATYTEPGTPITSITISRHRLR